MWSFGHLVIWSFGHLSFVIGHLVIWSLVKSWEATGTKSWEATGTKSWEATGTKPWEATETKPKGNSMGGNRDQISGHRGQKRCRDTYILRIQ